MAVNKLTIAFKFEKAKVLVQWGGLVEDKKLLNRQHTCKDKDKNTSLILTIMPKWVINNVSETCLKIKLLKLI